jgi:hypothetical protein
MPELEGFVMIESSTPDFCLDLIILFFESIEVSVEGKQLQEPKTAENKKIDKFR